MELQRYTDTLILRIMELNEVAPDNLDIVKLAVYKIINVFINKFRP